MLLIKLNEDLLSEIIQYLKLKDIKQLYLVDRDYRIIFQNEGFKEMLKQKVKEEQMYQEKVDQIFHDIKNGYLNYSDNNYKLSYYGTPKGQIIEEEITGENYQRESILRSLFGEEAMIKSKNRREKGVKYDGPRYKLINPTREKMEQVINRLVQRSSFDLISCF